MGNAIIKKYMLFKTIQRIFFIILGVTLASVALENFLVPNNIIDGGITGISIMLSHVTNLGLGIFLFILNVPFLIIGYKQIGKTFAYLTFFSITSLSVATTLLHHTKPTTQDPLLAAVFGGIILGIGVGLVIRNSGSLDGTEIIAILLSKKSSFSVGQIVLFFNIFILSSAGFLFGWDRAMYSLIAYFVAVKMMDLMIEGLSQTKSIWIISDKHHEIGEEITRKLGRGVTYLNGEGAYRGDEKKVIFCIISRIEEATLKTIVDDVDPKAFLAVGDIHDVKGAQFTKKSIH